MCYKACVIRVIMLYLTLVHEGWRDADEKRAPLIDWKIQKIKVKTDNWRSHTCVTTGDHTHTRVTTGDHTHTRVTTGDHKHV